MKLKENVKKIKDFLLRKYKNNLAAILIFGSANTGHFIEGKSDIDNMIFLKKKGNINSKEEINFLIKKLKKYNFATQYFNDLNGIKKYIQEGTHFSSYITIVSKDGAKIIYTTPKFEKTRDYLRKHLPLKKNIKEIIKEKDRFELEGYFKKIKGFDLTKALMSHLRRKLQIMNYFQNRDLIFDYEKCLNNIDLNNKEKNKLEKLYENYSKRKILTKKENNYFRNLAKRLSNKIELL